MSITVNTNPTAIGAPVVGNNNAIVAKLVAVKPMIEIPSGLLRGVTFKLKDASEKTYLVKTRRSYKEGEGRLPYSQNEIEEIISRKLRIDIKVVSKALDKLGTGELERVTEKIEGGALVSCAASNDLLVKMKGLKEYNLFLLPSNRLADKSAIAEFAGLSVDEESEEY